MGLLTLVGRIVLVVANAIFMMVSMIMIALGFILKFVHEFIRPYVKDILDDIESTAKDLGSSADFDTEKFELGNMVSNIALCFIVIGFGLLAFSVIGCCGSCYGYRILVLVYAIIVLVVLLAQIAAAVIVYGFPKTIKDHIEPTMKDSLDEYQGINGTTVVSLGWNWAMQQYHCCGVKNYNDFTDRPRWLEKDENVTPTACCKVLPKTANSKKECAGDKADTSYDSIPEIATNSNYDEGCLDAVWETTMEDNMRYCLPVACFCFCVEVVLILFAFLIFKDKKGIKSILL